MVNAERDAWLFLNQIPTLSPIRFHRLLAAAQSAEAILRMGDRELQAAGVLEDQARQWVRDFQDPRFHKALDRDIERMEKSEFCAVSEIDESYPAALRELAGRPPVLYIKGAWPPPERLTIGLVGTRRPSSYGISVARRFTTDLVRQGVVTVSGMASGIDTCVHQATLKEEGATMAVLGHGFGHCFPAQNAGLFKEISEKGALVTEFPYDSAPESAHFPRRNRIISGLARGVVVIEAGHRSGALITARYAAEQGRDVFAVPGSIFQSTSAGCHRLLKEGAKLAEHAGEILEEYGADVISPPAVDKTILLEPFEKEVMSRVSGEPVSVDELAGSLEKPFDQLAGTLLSLELKGFIKRLPGQRYVAHNC